MKRDPITVHPGRGCTAGFGLGPLFDNWHQARCHANEQGWALYRIADELVAITPMGLAIAKQSNTGSMAIWWEHAEMQ